MVKVKAGGEDEVFEGKGASKDKQALNAERSQCIKKPNSSNPYSSQD